MAGWACRATLPCFWCNQAYLTRPRAPAGRHTAWAYCHVPNGSTVDMTASIEKQIERFAPGFHERILARRTAHAQAMEQYNPNYVGGDINGGVQDLFQQFTRPAIRLDTLLHAQSIDLSFARLPHLLAEACMACVATWLRRRCCGGKRAGSPTRNLLRSEAVIDRHGDRKCL